MATYYTCTQVTPEVYDAYLKYRPKGEPYSFHEMKAVSLSIRCRRLIIYPVCRDLNTYHLREFGITDPQSCDGDSNIIVSVEEFFSQLFILELEQ